MDTVGRSLGSFVRHRLCHFYNARKISNRDEVLYLKAYSNEKKANALLQHRTYSVHTLKRSHNIDGWISNLWLYLSPWANYWQKFQISWKTKIQFISAKTPSKQKRTILGEPFGIAKTWRHEMAVWTHLTSFYCWEGLKKVLSLSSGDRWKALMCVPQNDILKTALCCIIKNEQ